MKIGMENTTVGYGHTMILNNLRFTVHDGQILSLIGPNGTGKSTVLKTLAGQLKSLSGKVYYDKDEIQNIDANKQAQIRAIVSTHRIHPEWMTCYDVVAAGRYPFTGQLGILQTNDKKIIMESMHTMHIEDWKDENFNTLSDGQKQRVLIARALAQKPKVLILDEPTSYLDIAYQIELMDVLKQCAKEGMIIIMAIHELDLALRYSDALLCLFTNKTVKYLTPKACMEDDVLQDLFGLKISVYEQLFGSLKETILKTNSYRCFTNTQCTFYPCHTSHLKKFNCLFCFCPLYGLDCKGEYTINKKGIKDCTHCLIPHDPDKYPYIMQVLRKENHSHADQTHFKKY